MSLTGLHFARVPRRARRDRFRRSINATATRFSAALSNKAKLTPYGPRSKARSSRQTGPSCVISRSSASRTCLCRVRVFQNDGLLNAHAQPETPRSAAAIESLLLTDAIADLLTSIDGVHNYTVHQTILFFMPPGTLLHLDGWGLDTEPRGFSHTLGIPLEPVGLHNGPIAIVPWPRGKIVSSAELDVEEPSEPADGSRRPKVGYHAALERYLRHHAPDYVVPQLDSGDMVVFASATPHGTLPFASPSRWAMQVLVRPSNLRWGSWPEFAAGISSSPKDPWRSLKSVGSRWRIIAGDAT